MMKKGDLVVCVKSTKVAYEFCPIVGEVYIIMHNRSGPWIYTRALGRYDRERETSFQMTDFEMIGDKKLLRLVRLLA
jgi:hypothetical protein